MTRKQTTWITILACVMIFAFSGAAHAQVPITAEIAADRPNIFANESFNLTISIDSGGERVSPEVTLLSMPDKSRLVTGKFDELPPHRQVHDNQMREIRTFRCKARAPIPGPIELAPTLKLDIISRERVFMGLADLRTSCDIRVAPLNLNINTIPTNGCPSDFSGAVGQFNFDVNAAPMDVAVGDLVTLTMKIHGDGYLEPVSSPRLFAGQDFKIYDPEPGDGKPIEGEKTFTQICIPQNTNAVSIPAVSFSYFDGRAGTYKRITSGPFHLKFHSRKAASFEQYRPSQTTAVTTAAQNSGTGESMVSLSGTSPSYAGSLWRKIMHEGRQAVAIRSETAMFAPSHSSLVSFDVPNGRLVTVVEIQGNWSKIALGDKRGWVPTECLSTQ